MGELFNHDNIKEITNDKPMICVEARSAGNFGVLFESKKDFEYFTDSRCLKLMNLEFDESIVCEAVENIPELEDLIGRGSKNPKREKYEMERIYLGLGNWCLIRKDLVPLIYEYKDDVTKYDWGLRFNYPAFIKFWRKCKNEI